MLFYFIFDFFLGTIFFNCYYQLHHLLHKISTFNSNVSQYYYRGKGQRKMDSVHM